MSIPLSWWLIVSAALFSIGMYGALSRKNAIGILMGIELILNAVNINLVAFWRYREPTAVTGRAFALFVYAVAAIETAVCLALIIALWRTRNTILMEDAD